MECKPCGYKTSSSEFVINKPQAIVVEQRPCPKCGGPMESTVKQDRDTGKDFKIWYCLNVLCDYRERVD